MANPNDNINYVFANGDPIPVPSAMDIFVNDEEFRAGFFYSDFQTPSHENGLTF
jgi:hypothetical protein